MAVADSHAAKHAGSQTHMARSFRSVISGLHTQYPDQLRADQFLNEFEGFVRARQEGKGIELPQFVLALLAQRSHARLPAVGMPRPAASVADKMDLAVGRRVV
jgi:hypothetical protein